MSESDLCAALPSAAPNDENRTTNTDGDKEQAAVEGAEETKNGNENGSGNEAQSEEIAAYFKLESALFTYYCQTLVVTIGRRPPVPVRTGEASGSGSGAVGGGDGEGPLHEILTLGGPSNPPPSEPAGSSAGGSGPVVDVDLGQLKSVSRLHARIEYDENEACFVLAVIGRNGAWVDGDWYGANRKAPLTARSRIQIASRVFYFVLPDTAPPPSPPPSSRCSNHSHSRSRSRTRSRSRSRTVSLVRTTTPPRQRSPSVDIMSSADSGDDTQWAEPEPEPKPIRGRIAKKAPRGAATGKGKGKDKEEAEALAKGKSGKGKGKGKATSVSRDAKRKQPDPEPSTSKLAASKSTAASSKSTTVASKGTAAALKTISSHLPTPNSESEPAPIRPAITFATHCYHAIKALGGRATLAEICQWMRDKYEWFTSAEGLATKWESSVRHNLSSNKAFVAQKRTETEKGKGFYWSVDPASDASFLERERRVRPVANPATSAQTQAPLPAPADEGTDVSIDVEAEEDEIKGTGPPKRIDPSTVIDETKRRRAEKEERRRLKAEKRERRERREKERAVKAAKRLAATNPAAAAAAVPGQPPHPFFFPPYGQPYQFPPFAPPQDGQDGANPAPFMVKGPDGQTVPMSMPPSYMVPGPDGQMMPMPMPPYMMGMPTPGMGGGGKDGNPEGGQALPPFMVKGPDGQMVPAPGPMPGPYGFPPYGYPYYLPQGPYWMPYAPGEGKAGGSGGAGKEQGEVDPVVKQEDTSGGTLGHDEEKTVSPQPMPPWGMMPYPLPPHPGMMGAGSPGIPGVPPPGMVAMSPPVGYPAAGPSGSGGGAGEVPPAAAQVAALTMAAPTPALVPTSALLAPPAVLGGTSPGPAVMQTPAAPSPALVPAPSSISTSSLAPTTSTPVLSMSIPATPARPMSSATTPAPSISAATTPALPASTSTPAPTSAAPPTPTAAPASNLVKISIPIEVAPPPASYVPPTGGQASPYMILHEGKLWLSPEVFGKLSEERLEELRTLGAREVINKLQPDIVQYLKSKMRSGGRGRGRGRGRGGAVSGTPRPTASASPAPGNEIVPGVVVSSPGISTATPNTSVPAIGPSSDAPSIVPTLATSTPTDSAIGGSSSGALGVDMLPGPSSVVVSLDEKTHGLVRLREEDDEVAPEPKRPKPDAQTLAL